MGKDLSKTSHCILFCNGGSCNKKGAEKIVSEVRAYIKSEGLHHNVHTVRTRCNGRCEDAPTLIVMPENTWYKKMTAEKGIDLIEQHVKKNTPLAEYVLYAPGMETVLSDDPRPSPKPSFYEELVDSELGTVLVAKADPGEQNLYPMMKDVFQKFYNKAQLTIADIGDQPFVISKPVTLEYDQKWVSIVSGDFEARFAIGIPDKLDHLSYKEQRIGKVEVFTSMEEEFKGIRFKSKTGQTKLLIKDISPDQALWRHFNKIYLEISDIDTALKSAAQSIVTNS